MKYYIIKPEVPAGFGSNVIIERIPGKRDKILKLHLVFEDWFGADLMKTSPIFYVTERLKEELKNSDLSGIEGFDTAEVNKSENLLEMHPNLELPLVYYLKINGVPFKNDFGIDKGNLVISENAKVFLKRYNLSNAEIVEVKDLI